MTTETILDDFVASQATPALGRQRLATLARIRQIIDHDWLEVTPGDVVKLRSRLESTDHAPRTVRFYCQTLRAYLTRLTEAGLFPMPQLASIRRVTTPPARALGHAGRRLTSGEISRVLLHHATTPQDRFVKAAFFVLVTTGMRVSELLSLPRSTLQRSGRIDLLQKGSRPHTVWITAPVQQVLCGNWDDTPDGEYLVQWSSSRNRGQIRRNHLVRAFAELAERLDLPRFTPHDCRRTVATTLLESGHDPYVISSIMGHSKPETTAIYDHRPDSLKEEIIEDMVATIEEGKIKYRAPLRLVPAAARRVS